MGYSRNMASGEEPNYSLTIAPGSLQANNILRLSLKAPEREDEQISYQNQAALIQTSL